MCNFSEKAKKGTARKKGDNPVNIQKIENIFTCFERSPFTCHITLDIILIFIVQQGVSKITKFMESSESMRVFI